ncbi:MAG: BON domain-containing protein [Pseudomonadota bacterium]|nr:BON domain-containing protein [Pseudomonadota bacterium]
MYPLCANRPLNTIVVIAVLGIVLFLQGCAAAVVGGAAAGGYYVGKDERTIGEITEDASITTKINAKFVGDDLVKTFDIDVDTYRRTVYLYGHVDSAAARGRAVSLARSVKGVRSVVSKLAVTN